MTKERNLPEPEAFSPATRPFMAMRQELGTIVRRRDAPVLEAGDTEPATTSTGRSDSIVSHPGHANGSVLLVQVLDLRRPVASLVCNSDEGEPPIVVHAVQAGGIATGDGSRRMHA